jgi:GxxExxY protein
MARLELFEEALTRSAIGAFYDVYNALRFGFSEHVYMKALEHELRDRGHHVAREAATCVIYKGKELCTQRLDMVVDAKLIIEAKATIELHKSAHRQLYSYLRATDLEVGLLLHFGPKANYYRLICRNVKAVPNQLLTSPAEEIRDANLD